MSPCEPRGRCVCGAAVHGNGFRDRGSYLAFSRTGLCQACQDQVFLCSTGDDVESRVPLRSGAVVAVRGGEACFLPFVFVVPEPRIAWEARYIVRAGSGLEPIDPYDELAPMAEQLAEHQVQVAVPALGRTIWSMRGSLRASLRAPAHRWLRGFALSFPGGRPTWRRATFRAAFRCCAVSTLSCALR